MKYFADTVYLISGYIFLAILIGSFGKRLIVIDNRNNLNGLDVLRGILAYLVFSGHAVCMANFNIANIWWPPSEEYRFINSIGGLAVDVFFMVTGYLFTKFPPSIYKIPNFYLARVKRIYIPYSLTILFIIVFIYYDEKVWANSELWLFLLKGNLVDTSISLYHAPLYFHFWSLKLEVIFYLVLPLILYVEQKYFRFAYPIALGFMSLSVDYHFIFILIGHFVCRQNRVFRSGPTTIGLIFATLILIVINDMFVHSNYTALIIRCFIASFILVAFLSVNIKSDLFIYKHAIALGKTSYSLYLIHGLTLVMAFISYNKIFNIYNVYQYTFFATVLLVPMVILLYCFGERRYFRRIVALNK